MMEGFRKFWPLCLIIFLSFSCITEARHYSSHHKPSAVVVGTVFCDTCFQSDVSKASHYISGATVAVECTEEASRPAFYQEIQTDNEGKFKVQLPFSINKHVRKVQECTIKLLKSSEPNCAIASTATSSLIHLKDKQPGKHIFSAGFFTFKPLKQPNSCNQLSSVKNSQINPQLPSIPTLPNPQVPTLPIPNTPLPNLPNIPGVPELSMGPHENRKVGNGLVEQPQQVIPAVPLPPLPTVPLPPLPTVPLPPVPVPLPPVPVPLPPVPLPPVPLPPVPVPLPPVPVPLPPLPVPLPPVSGLAPPTPTIPEPTPTIPEPTPTIIPPLIPGIPPLKVKKVNP